MNAIIYKMCSAHGNMYAVIKAILKENEGLNLGSVKAPLAPPLRSGSESGIRSGCHDPGSKEEISLSRS